MIFRVGFPRTLSWAFAFCPLRDRKIRETTRNGLCSPQPRRGKMRLLRAKRSDALGLEFGNLLGTIGLRCSRSIGPAPSARHVFSPFPTTSANGCRNSASNDPAGLRRWWNCLVELLALRAVAPRAAAQRLALGDALRQFVPPADTQAGFSQRENHYHQSKCSTSFFAAQQN